MRKTIIYSILILLIISSCSPAADGEVTEQTPGQGAETAWPPVTSQDPSYRVSAFYYPWYLNPEWDGRWDHWDEVGRNPPLDVFADFYPALGAYSVSNPAVLAQHFAWLRDAGVGVIVSSWWGKQSRTDQAVPLMLDIADHYRLKVAFHIEPYSGRTARSLARDVEYIYAQYGDHPAFFWTTDTSRYSPENTSKGLFFIWASVVPDSDSPAVSPDYWQKEINALHSSDPGAIILTDQNDPAWVLGGHFDGSYNYGVLDDNQVGYDWAYNLPKDAWYVPGINPGFSIRRIRPQDKEDTPRRDGATYDDRWERMFAVGIEPEMVAITTFNEWHEGTQVEPAAENVTSPSGYAYQDYGPLGPEGYLQMTAAWAQKFLEHQWPAGAELRARVRTTSDWTDLYLVSGATWQGVEVVEVIGDGADAGMYDGHFGLSQPLGRAEAGNAAEAAFDVQLRAGDGDAVVFEIERGGLGATWVELYRANGEEHVLVESFAWSGHNAGGRNAARFEVEPEILFGQLP